MLHERFQHVSCKDHKDSFEKLLKIDYRIMKIYRHWLSNFIRQRQVNFFAVQVLARIVLFSRQNDTNDCKFQG